MIDNTNFEWLSSLSRLTHLDLAISNTELTHLSLEASLNVFPKLMYPLIFYMELIHVGSKASMNNDSN